MLAAQRLAILAQVSAAAQALALQRPAWAVSRQHSHTGRFQSLLSNKDGRGMEYSAELNIGGQALRGILDTGSYELLVFSTLCDSCGDIANYYNESRSKTHTAGSLKTEHTFGSGNTWSQLAYDSVEIGSLHTHRQYFWQVIGASLPVVSKGSFQAIVGVGPPSTPRVDSMAQAEKAEELKRSLKAGNVHVNSHAKDMAHDALALASEPTLLESFGVLTFSVCIGREDGSDGYFVWNDDDPRKKPPGLFTATPVVGNATWGVQLMHIRLDSRTGGPESIIGCKESCGAIIDSGTSLIVVPTKVAERAAEELNHLHSDCSDLDLLPDLKFDLAGSRFTLPPHAYVGQFTGSLPGHLTGFATHRRKGGKQATSYRACELLLLTMDVTTQVGDMIILGLPFFREYYTTFDLGTGIWDERNRSLFMAQADKDCRPQMPPKNGPSNLMQRRMRSVDLTKVRLPAWAKKAAVKGSVHL